MTKRADVVMFRCPKCESEWLAGTADGQMDWKPPTCSWAHDPTEMEQVYLGSDAYRPATKGDTDATE